MTNRKKAGYKSTKEPPLCGVFFPSSCLVSGWVGADGGDLKKGLNEMSLECGTKH